MSRTPPQAHRQTLPEAAANDERTVLERADWPWLATLLLVGCLVLVGVNVHAQRVTAGRGGVPLDDAWIHFQFARNLARGEGFAFNPGEPTAGSTAPLWTLLLAAVYAAGGGFPAGAKALSGASYLLSLLAAFALGKCLTGRRWAAWLAAAVAAVNGRLVWAGLSALETPLFAALTLMAAASHLRKRAATRYHLRTAALFGLASLTRPEGTLFFALSLADYALGARVDEGGEPATPRPLLKHAWSAPASLVPAVGLYGLMLLPYVLFSLRTAGHVFPNTFSAKATVTLRPDLAFLSLAARYLILDSPLLLPFFVLGLGVLFGRARAIAAWVVGLPLAYALLHASLYQHGRYLIPLIPFNAVVAVVGLLAGARLAARRGWRWSGGRRWVGIPLVVLALAGTAWRLPTMARHYAQDVKTANQMHVAIVRWEGSSAPEDALLALNDIGAIGYVSERRVVDLAGLVTPEVVPMLRSPERASRLLAYMAARGVDYVIIFPDWFPGLAERADLLQPVHYVTLEERTITGGETMVVYRADWTALE